MNRLLVSMFVSALVAISGGLTACGSTAAPLAPTTTVRAAPDVFTTGPGPLDLLAASAVNDSAATVSGRVRLGPLAGSRVLEGLLRLLPSDVLQRYRDVERTMNRSPVSLLQELAFSTRSLDDAMMPEAHTRVLVVVDGEIVPELVEAFGETFGRGAGDATPDERVRGGAAFLMMIGAAMNAEDYATVRDVIVRDTEATRGTVSRFLAADGSGTEAGILVAGNHPAGPFAHYLWRGGLATVSGTAPVSDPIAWARERLRQPLNQLRRANAQRGLLDDIGATRVVDFEVHRPDGDGTVSVDLDNDILAVELSMSSHKLNEATLRTLESSWPMLKDTAPQRLAPLIAGRVPPQFAQLLLEVVAGTDIQVDGDRLTLRSMVPVDSVLTALDQ